MPLIAELIEKIKKIRENEKEIVRLNDLAKQNLKVGEELLEKKLVDNINAYTENNRRIVNKVEELEAEITTIMQNLITNEQNAVIQQNQN